MPKPGIRRNALVQRILRVTGPRGSSKSPSCAEQDIGSLLQGTDRLIPESRGEVMRSHMEQLKTYIDATKAVIPIEELSEVEHYYDHNEPEMTFEGLVIDLMTASKYPEGFNCEAWKELVMHYGLDPESVFRSDFWTEFQT